MWIRSQDRKVLKKVNELAVHEAYDGERIAIKAYDHGEEVYTTYLGEYATEEIALEVLDEIQNAICYHKATEIMNHRLDGLSNDVINGFVYQMPEK